MLESDHAQFEVSLLEVLLESSPGVFQAPLVVFADLGALCCGRMFLGSRDDEDG